MICDDDASDSPLYSSRSPAQAHSPSAPTGSERSAALERGVSSTCWAAPLCQGAGSGFAGRPVCHLGPSDRASAAGLQRRKPLPRRGRRCCGHRRQHHRPGTDHPGHGCRCHRVRLGDWACRCGIGSRAGRAPGHDRGHRARIGQLAATGRRPSLSAVAERCQSDASHLRRLTRALARPEGAACVEKPSSSGALPLPSRCWVLLTPILRG